MAWFELVVGNLGTVYSGGFYDSALAEFAVYQKRSIDGIGRASGEPVTLLKDGEPIREYSPEPEPEPGPVKFNLTRERLNSGGYTARGRYFGTGAPLYYYADVETGEVCDYIRAHSREDAKAIIRAKYPTATFFN